MVYDPVVMMAKEMQEEVDWQLIADLLVKHGDWIEVIVDISYHEKSEVLDWIDLNCKGQVKVNWGRWLFSNQTDADWFAMRWA